MRGNNCSRCIYTDSPCVPSDYGRDEHNNCDHYKSVFEENKELREKIEKMKSDVKEMAEQADKNGNMLALKRMSELFEKWECE